MKWLVLLCSTSLWIGLSANPMIWAGEAEIYRSSTPLPEIRSGPACCPAPIQPICPTPGAPGMPGTPGTPGTPGMPNPTQPDANAPAQQPAQDAFSQSPEAGSLAADTFDPGVFGDLLGAMGTRIPGLPPPPSAPGQTTPSGNRIAIVAPLPYSGTFKISENESPRPVDRVFLNYNYFDDVTKGTPYPVGAANLNREEIGLEKTFLGGDASVGIRLPFLQLTGNSTIDQSEVGDISLVFKYALINDRETHDVLSTGMVVTLPTGPAIDLAGESSVNSTIFQPWVGFIYHFGQDVFFQGFSSIAVPTDARDVTLMFNSIAAGYYLYRDSSKDSWLQSLVPVAELHLNTPFDHRGWQTEPIGYPDALDATLGCYFNFHRASLGTAIGFPLTGPKPYDVEGTVNLNVRY